MEKEEEKIEVPESPSLELTRDEKGTLYYQLEDFEELFKSLTKKGKITNAQVYAKYPFLYKATEYVEDPLEDDTKQKKKKRRKNFNFGFESTKEIELEELMRIFKESPFQYNYPVAREVFDSFLAQESNPDYVDIKKLKELMEDMNLASFNNEEDLKTLVEALDKDKDGKLSFKDLFHNIPFHQYSAEEMGGIKKCIGDDMSMAQKSPVKGKDRFRKREVTCCIVNKDMLKN